MQTEDINVGDFKHISNFLPTNLEILEDNEDAEIKEIEDRIYVKTLNPNQISIHPAY